MNPAVWITRTTDGVDAGRAKIQSRQTPSVSRAARCRRENEQGCLINSWPANGCGADGSQRPSNGWARSRTASCTCCWVRELCVGDQVQRQRALVVALDGRAAVRPLQGFLLGVFSTLLNTSRGRSCPVKTGIPVAPARLPASPACQK